MFTNARLQECFTGLVGFMQPNDPQYSVIDADLTVSASGRYVQHVHELCTLENIYNTAPEFDKFTYPAWAAGIYSATSIVSHGGSKYKALVDIVALDTAPGTDPAKWVKIDPFSEFLRGIMKAAAVEMASDFIKAKKLDHTQKSIVDSLRLYDGLGNLNDRIIKHGRFVGFEILLNRQEGLQVVIQKVGLQLDTIQVGPLNFYLYHSSVAAPLATFPVNFATANTFAWKDLQSAILKFYDTHDTDGRFYFGYYEDDLTGQAVKKIMRWDGPCSSCDHSAAQLYAQWSKYVTLRPVYIESSEINATDLPNLSELEYVSDTNWGLNFALSVYCDLTEFFCTNKHLAADAYAMKICVKLLNVIAYTTRMTGITDKTKSLAMADLDPNPKSGSFLNSYNDQLLALSLDFSGLSSACMPCNASRGMVRRSI